MVVVKRAEIVLMDRAALAQWTGRSVRVIRQHCVIIEYDPAGRAMYDARAAADLLLKVTQRPRSASLTKR